jgi:hypothetical protein
VYTEWVPTPDPPPSVAAREARDFALAGAGMTAGLVLLASGLVGLVLFAIAHLVRRRRHNL